MTLTLWKKLMWPPSNLIWNVMSASPSQTMIKVPAKTSTLCSSVAAMLSRVLSVRQKRRGPQRSQSWTDAAAVVLAEELALRTAAGRGWCRELKPPDSSIELASGHRLARRNRGQSTESSLRYTEYRSRDRVSHTDSSSVSRGARRSDPGIDDVSSPGFNRLVLEVVCVGVGASRGSSTDTACGKSVGASG